MTRARATFHFLDILSFCTLYVARRASGSRVRASHDALHESTKIAALCRKLGLSSDLPVPTALEKMEHEMGNDH